MKRWDCQMNTEIFGNSSKWFWFFFMVNQNLKEDSLSTSNFLLKTSKQNLWLHFKELNTTWIFQNLALISNELIKSIKEAHCRYQDELEKQRKQKQESQKSLSARLLPMKSMHSKRNTLNWYLKSRCFVQMQIYLLLKQKSFMAFVISHNRTNRKNLLTRSKKKWWNYKKRRKTSARSVKKMLFVYKFICRVIV